MFIIELIELLPPFHLSLASFLIKSSHILIFRFGWALSIINALFKNSESVHAFFYSTSICQAANKCQAVKRTQRWLRLSRALNFNLRPNRQGIPAQYDESQADEEQRPLPPQASPGTRSTQRVAVMPKSSIQVALD